MADLATIARPYAEALFKAASEADQTTWLAQVQHLAALASDPQIKSLAGNPLINKTQVFEVIAGSSSSTLSPAVGNFLRTVLENGRLAALPLMAQQFQALVRAHQGVLEAVIYSAFPIDAAQLADILGPLEKRFGLKLKPSVQVDSSLIGGVRVVVGDEVLDTSVKARLERMKSTLVA